MFIDETTPGYYWLMYQTRFAEHCMWENGRIASRHLHNGRVYPICVDNHLDVAVGAMVADY